MRFLFCSLLEKKNNIHFEKAAGNQQNVRHTENNFIFVPYRSVGINTDIARFKGEKKKCRFFLRALYQCYITSSGFSFVVHTFSKTISVVLFIIHFNVFIWFFFNTPRAILRSAKCYLECAIILTRVILFNSSYVYVDVLSDFHVSTSMLLFLVYFFFFCVGLHALTRPPNNFIIRQRFHLRKLIRQTAN